MIQTELSPLRYFDNRRRIIAIIIATLSSVALLAHLSHANEPTDTRVLRNLLCGPRCTIEVLEAYGKDSPDVMEVADEVCKEGIAAGSCLSELADYIERHGIHTLEIRLADYQSLEWQGPAIFHWNPQTHDDVAGKGMGHFVIRYSSDDQDRIRYFDGVGSVRTISKIEWHKRRSGYVLLTSKHPIRLEKVVVTDAGFSSDSQTHRRLSGLALICGMNTFGSSILFVTFKVSETRNALV